MRRCLIAFMGCLVLTLSAAGEAGAQEDSAVRRKIEAQLGDLAHSTHEALHGLLFYPKEVRDACLELARYPGLIVRLNDAITRGGFAPDKVLVNYPPEVRPAARVLAGTPESLDALEDDLVSTGVLGRMYADDPAGVTRLVDVLAAKANLAAMRAADAWVNSLALSDLAVAELQRAADDYARTADTTTITFRADLGHGFGFSVEASSNIAVHYAPSYAETRFVLYNADRYPHLADALVYDYHHHYDECQDDLRRAYEEWYHRYVRYYPDDFLRATGRATRLKQAAAYERRFVGTHKGRARGVAERNDFLRQHASDYPLIVGFRDPATARGPRYIATPTAPRRTPSRVTRPTNRRSTRATRTPGKGKSRVDTPRTHTPRVIRKAPSSAQRIHRARRVRRIAPGRTDGIRKTRVKGSDRR